MVKLVISDNDGTTTVVPVVRDDISIGRRQGNTIRLTERNVSRDHAQLRRRDGAYLVVDLDSYNGVQVNGRSIAGEQELVDGDEIRIGDYTMALQMEEEAGSSNTGAALAGRPTAPARLVMLSDPSPGAEFALPATGTVSLGRSEELEIPINHPSVSRVHAELDCSAEGYLLRDRGSANGAIVGGERVTERQLVPGDIIEFGQVVLRFVGPGEHFFFDASEVRNSGRIADPGGGLGPRVIGGVLAVAAAIGLFVYFGGPGRDDGGPGPETPPIAAVGMGATPGGYSYGAALEACRDALGAGRHGEALAHATLALKAQPGGVEAAACKADASRRFGDEQAFERGKTALDLGDLLAANAAFSLMSADSPLRQRPEVTRTLRGIADAELQEAEGLLSSDPAAAKAQAEAVARMTGIDAARREAAQALAARAGEAQSPRKSKSKSKPKSKTKRTSKRKPATVAKRDAVKATTKPSTTEPQDSAPAEAQSGQTPMQQATACLAKGDNQCVIAVLSGSAKSAKEMALLIETYRAVGNTSEATRYMDLYIKRFPTARRANAYKQTLARQDD